MTTDELLMAQQGLQSKHFIKAQLKAEAAKEIFSFGQVVMAADTRITATVMVIPILFIQVSFKSAIYFNIDDRK